MKVAIFDTHSFERGLLTDANESYGHELHFIEARLTAKTAALANGFPVVCSFANDRVDKEALRILHTGGVKLIALRSAGYNHIDMPEAKNLGFKIVRVPAYSPYAIAEHAVSLILTLNRKIHKAYNRVRELNFSLDGLVGFDLHGKTIGVIGTGRIGAAFCKIMNGFGCRILAHDQKPNSTLSQLTNFEYTTLAEIYRRCDVISLHVPLSSNTLHLLNEDAFKQMKPNVIVINTGRGALIDAKALIGALKAKRIQAAGLDVYEEEENIFFRDLSNDMLLDETLARLLTFPNVVVTSHQGFLTIEALNNIATTTLDNIDAYSKGKALQHEVVI